MPISVKDCVAYLNTTSVHRLAAVLFIVALGIGLGVGISVETTKARNASNDDYDRRFAIFSQWQMSFTSQITKASSLAGTISSFAMATVTTPANMSAAAPDRQRYLDQSAFDRMGQKFYIEGITAMALAPGGVVTQMYPPGSAYFGLDIFTDYDWHLFAATSETYITGPATLAWKPGYALFVWSPVHTSNVTNDSTFWGVAYVMIEIPILLESVNVIKLVEEQNMDYVMWFVPNSNPSARTVIAESDSTATSKVLEDGMRMELPISEAGLTSYLAIYPKGGTVSENMKAGQVVLVVFVTLICAAVVVMLVYLCAYALFRYRHRLAPKSSQGNIYIAAFTLRNAQPIADRAPLVALKMFNEFTDSVRQLALINGCYPVCEIGDRCVYVVASNPESILKLARSTVADVAISGNMQPDQSSRSPGVQLYDQSSRPSAQQLYASTAAKTAVSRTEDMTESSFIGATTCNASVAIHTITSVATYDDSKDVYFYGNSTQLAKLCASLDMTKCGEVCWTDAFNSTCPTLCREAADSALSSHIISENDEIVLHVANWWRDTGDERDTEDPSTAMAVLSDAYVRKMTVIVSKGQLEAKEHRRKGADETKSGTSHRSFEATSLVRTATLLHISILNGDEKHALEIIQRTVTEEKGTVISAFDSTVIAAFNLLSAGGHHQVRAADTVLRLREALPSTKFVCSISHGKVNALILGDLVMCTGDAATRGRGLLKTAIALACPGTSSHGTDDVTYLTSDTDMSVVKKRFSSVVVDNGLCLLVGKDELSSTYDCEGVDVGSFCGKTRVVYRLALRKSGNKANGDEWMYRLRDDEDQSPFAIVNAVFEKIAGRDLEEAARIWKDYSSQVGTTADNCGMEISSHAKAAIARLLPTAAPNPKSKHVSPL
eukprot:GILJ01014468.1.p1 GENE.GILJ01014468.1~~GILJ01014468.1.p1  ORF type:complete len:891 (+),score=139.89 GILJ01014468.1:204-2876(+)